MQLGVPMNDLSRRLRAEEDELTAVFRDVLAEGRLIQGSHHTAFEQELAVFVGAEHCVGVASGTDALELCFRALTSPERRTIVTVANAGGYSTLAAQRAGLAVRFADVDPVTLCLDPSTLVGMLDDAVAAVVVTHLYGRAADVPAVLDVCDRAGIPVVEDCAQAIGATAPWGKTGSAGALSAFSFYPTKNLGALGDGGAVVTSDHHLAAKVRALRQYGWSSRYEVSVRGGCNSRLDELQAAFLRLRLPHVQMWNETRRSVIGRYSDAASSSTRVLEANGLWHAGHLAVVVTEDAADLARHLASRYVRTDVHYPIPDHRQPALAEMYADVHLPETEALTGRILSLPCFPEITEREVDLVCRALGEY